MTRKPKLKSKPLAKPVRRRPPSPEPVVPPIIEGVPRPGRTAGRPPYEPTEKDRMTVKVMIAGGIQQDAIADVIGLKAKALRKHFRREIDTAAAEANAAVVASLFKMTKSNVAAAIWWTKTRMKWSEKIVVEGEGDAFGFGKLLAELERRRRKSEK